MITVDGLGELAVLMGGCLIEEAEGVLGGAFCKPDGQRIVVREAKRDFVGEFSLEEQRGVVEGEDPDEALDVIVLEDVDIVQGEERIHSKAFSEDSSWAFCLTNLEQMSCDVPTCCLPLWLCKTTNLIHSERRVPHALFGVDSIGGQSARLAAADFHPHASFLQAQLVDALHFHSQSHNKFITMKNQVVNRAFENLFQLNTEPIYVTQQPAQDENLIDTMMRMEQVSPRKKNMCPNIFNALCNVQENGVIKINSGLFTENVEIRVPGIRIQNNDPKSNVILASEQNPTLIIELPNKQDKVYLENLKFAHLCEYDKEILRWPSLKELRDNRYRGLTTAYNMNTSILLRKGTLQIDECRLSFAGQRDSSRLFPIISVEEEGSLILTRSELVGGAGSIGIYCNGGKVNIRECSFKNHGGIGLLITGGKETSLVLKNSNIMSCGDGVVLNGPFSSSIQNNNITNCASAGFSTLFGNICNIINNEVMGCKVGIEVENSLPKIMKNNLLRNKEYGLSVHSRMNGECKPHIRFNVVSENKKGGVLVSGSRNRAEIYNNKITYNQNVGVKVEINAHPHIFLNEISKNFGNGVYFSSGATSFLEKNKIFGSVNCNLILEGPNNIDNYVYNNKIMQARGQGVLLLYCEKFLIAKNEISHNYNGIMAITSVVNIEDNKIHDNRCNGIMLIDDCHILMSENAIEGNRKTGFICRNTSKAKMRQNRFTSNRIEVLIEKSWDGIGDIENQNEFVEGSDVRIPGNLCALI